MLLPENELCRVNIITPYAAKLYEPVGNVITIAKCHIAAPTARYHLNTQREIVG